MQKQNLLARERGTPNCHTTHVLELDMSTVEPTVAGPKRPQDKGAHAQFENTVVSTLDKTFSAAMLNPRPQTVNSTDVRSRNVEGEKLKLRRLGDCGYHELHQYLQPRRNDWRGFGGETWD